MKCCLNSVSRLSERELFFVCDTQKYGNYHLPSLQQLDIGLTDFSLQRSFNYREKKQQICEEKRKRKVWNFP